MGHFEDNYISIDVKGLAGKMRKEGIDKGNCWYRFSLLGTCSKYVFGSAVCSDWKRFCFPLFAKKGRQGGPPNW